MDPAATGEDARAAKDAARAMVGLTDIIAAVGEGRVNHVMPVLARPQ